QRRSLDGNKQVYGNRLRLRIERSQFGQHPATIVPALTETENASAAKCKAGLPRGAESGQAVVISSRGDDVRVVLAAGIEVVVISVQTGLFQAACLRRREHAESG